MDDKIIEILDYIVKNMLTKDDAKNFVTKEYLNKVLSDYPTKQYLNDQLHAQKQELRDDIVDAITDHDKGLDEVKADKEQVDKFEKRLRIVERKVAVA